MKIELSTVKSSLQWIAPPSDWADLAPLALFDSNKQSFTFVIITQSNDEIWYTSADGNVITLPSTGEFNVNIKSNTYNKYGTGVITFDGDLTNIGNEAFHGCGDLTSITIPNSVTGIGRMAFYSCTSLTSIIYEGTKAQWNAIPKGPNWNYNVPAAYVQCSDGQANLQANL